MSIPAPTMPPLAPGHHRVLVYEGSRLMTWADSATLKSAWRVAVQAVRALAADAGVTGHTLEAPRGRARYSSGNFAAVTQARVR